MSSPQTDRTLVMEDVPEPSGTAPLTKADGITAVLFDFKADLLTVSTYATASTLALTRSHRRSCHAKMPTWPST